MKYEKIGQVYFDEENRIIGRKPTKSNMLETSGSDNDIYLCNKSQVDVVNKIKRIIGISNLEDFNKTKIAMNFYGTDLEFIFNINSQGRISFRITGKNRLYGMIQYLNDIFDITLDVDNILLFFNFDNNTVFFGDYDKIFTIY